MKKIFALALALVMVLTLAACGGGNGGTDQTPAGTDPPKGYDAEYTVVIDGSGSWTPFENGSGATFAVGKGGVISTTDDGKTVKFTGLAVGETDITATSGSDTAKALVKVVKRSGNAESAESAKFTGHYQYLPPTDNYHIAYTNKDGDEYDFAKIGDNEALIDGYAEWQQFSNISTGAYFTVVDGHWYDDVEFGFTEFSEAVTIPLDYFEHDIASKLRSLGFGDEKLAEYYVGTETYLDIDCWVFDSKGFNGVYAKYWVDPSNGATLKKSGTTTDAEITVTIYDLNYISWDSYFLPD